jgi:phosphoribosylanthranilate isomerase
MRVRVKICGITSQRDADAAVAAGADALGFVFYPPSPRSLTPATAAAIIAGLPPFVTSVGMFVDPDPADIVEILETAGPDVVQFHGDEQESLCLKAARPYIKAFNIRAGFDIARAEAQYPSAVAFLLDSDVPGAKGGTGVAFDWRLWPARCTKPLLLAGGLTPFNVAAAIAATQPYAVDVSGGVEGAIKGCKDEAKLQHFINEVIRVDGPEHNRR